MSVMTTRESDYDPDAEPTAADAEQFYADRDWSGQDADELSDWLDTLCPQDDPAYDAWVDAQECAGDTERDEA